jgi:hypothetical protein
MPYRIHPDEVVRNEQFPSILFQVLQEIETEGFVCRELYVNTFSVNLSKATEEVAAIYRVKIIPISAGTPEEIAYAESAVRVIGEMSRTLILAGAKHLPRSCWGLADLYAAYIHNFLPQAKLNGITQGKIQATLPDIFLTEMFYDRFWGRLGKMSCFSGRLGIYCYSGFHLHILYTSSE